MKVLAGVDGSQKSLDGIQFASRMLDVAKDHFVFYYSPPQVTIDGEEEMVPSIPADIRAQLVEKVFDTARQALPTAFQQNLETIVGETKAADGLLSTAEQTAADLIVVGADAKGRNFGPFLGGVARQVARDATVPVLVYRDRQPSGDDRLHVILAHDGSSDSTQAGRQLTQFRWPQDARGTIVRVMNWIDLRVAGDPLAPTMFREDIERFVATAKARSHQALIAASDQMPVLFRSAPPEIVEGNVVQNLCELAKQKHADLIVVGPHHRGLTRRILGATTESLLHYAPCSVLVAHRRDAG